MSNLFPLGQILATKGALALGINFNFYLILHVTGRWGVVCQEDWQANDAAVKDGTRILSAYLTEAGEKFWIITEADRSATTVLLPDEY